MAKLAIRPIDLFSDMAGKKWYASTISLASRWVRPMPSTISRVSSALVSLLEPGSEFYNTGIVDVFHRYPKMYVVRPQLFLPIITLLRNAATNSLKCKSELALVAELKSDDVTE